MIIKNINRKEYMRLWSLKNKERRREYNRQYAKTHRKQRRERDQKWRENNRDKLREGYKKYKRNNSERYKERSKIYRAKNKDKMKRYRENNKEGISKSRREYYINNQDKIKEYNNGSGRLFRKWNTQKRLSKLKKVIHIFTKQEWEQKLRESSGICPDCNLYIGIDKLTLDHIHPLSKAEEGRIYTIDDIQPLCLSCNQSKGGRLCCV